MPHTLITTLLEQALRADSSSSNLAALLNKRTGFFKYDGGLGDDYQKIVPFLTLDQLGKITAINAIEVLKIASDLLEKNSKKSAYKAGICFALVAIYGDDILIKLEGYKQLVTLFAEGGFLKNEKVCELCTQRLTSIPLNNNFFLTENIIWSWVIKGGPEALTFEMARQSMIINDSKKQNIRMALFLLGLNKEDALNPQKISETYNLCKSHFKTVTKLTSIQAKKSVLMKNFKDAEFTLLQYIEFHAFNFKAKFHELKNLINKIEQEDISNEFKFNQITKCIKIIDLQTEIMAQIPESYLTDTMLIECAGRESGDLSDVVRELEKQVRVYWGLICAKIDGLCNKAEELLNRTNGLSNISSQAMASIIQFQEKISRALSILSEVNGDATECSSVISNAIHYLVPIERKQKDLWAYSTKLAQKEAEQKEYVVKAAKKIVTLSQEITEERKFGVDAIDFRLHMSKQLAMLIEVDRKLDWLSGLDERSKGLAETEIRTHLVSQTTPEQVAEIIYSVLTSVDKVILEQAMTNILGCAYNSNGSININLINYFKRKKDSNIQETALSFFGELKEQIRELGGIMDLKINNLIPKPVSMTFELVVQQLQQHKTELPLSIQRLADKLNAALQSAIPHILKKYEETFLDIETRFKEKNNRKFLWQNNMQTFAAMKKELFVAVQKLETAIPTDPVISHYIKASVKSLILTFKQKKTEMEQIVSALEKEAKEANLAILQFNLLKDHIVQKEKAYKAKGTHHQDRIDSLDRLLLQIEQLNCNNALNANQRFLKLLQSVHQEEIKTAKSHERIGFFGKWRFCRLQKIYLDILNDFSYFDNYFSKDELSNDELVHKNRMIKMA